MWTDYFLHIANICAFSDSTLYKFLYMIIIITFMEDNVHNLILHQLQI